LRVVRAAFDPRFVGIVPVNVQLTRLNVVRDDNAITCVGIVPVYAPESVNDASLRSKPNCVGMAPLSPLPKVNEVRLVAKPNWVGMAPVINGQPPRFNVVRPSNEPN